ncbi:MAG: hypothetical protein Q4C59_09790 [Lachnospiraceae bacterium]|nr:hypothetical protein [Lachnospiraceae bacterium]
MEQKNRFSSLLEYLMNTAGLKNYILAQELQYDVSYISKWVNGKMIPSEKTEQKVLSGISHCIANSATEEGAAQLKEDYQVRNANELEMAIYDNLVAEYNYAREQQKDTIVSAGERVYFFPELPLEKYIVKMQHPVLRRVKFLDIMAEMDLMSMNHEYRIQIVSLQSVHPGSNVVYSDVHFSLVINLDHQNWDYIYDTIFIINMLTKMCYVDFQFYGSHQSRGRIIFTVKNDFSISGMLVNKDKCMAVVTTEEKSACNVMYQHIKSLCNREMLLFVQSTMKDLLVKNEYVRALLAPNPRWLMGHMTEVFLPDDLFSEIVSEMKKDEEEAISIDELYRIHQTTKNILEKSTIRLMFYENAFSDLAVSGELDFYNYKIILTPEQRLHYMSHMLDVFEQNRDLELRLIYGRLVSDFKYISNECVFISDMLSYLRLNNDGSRNKIMILNQAEMQMIFNQFFEEVWNKDESAVISDTDSISGYIRHIMQGITLLSHMK